MKTSTDSRKLVMTRTGLAIAAFALAGCAADDPANPQQGASRTESIAATSAEPVGEPPCEGAASQQTLFLEDADGNAFQLVHCRGLGWKYVGAGNSGGGEHQVALRKISFSPVAVSQADTTAIQIDDPMTVFIDGPTGYTFAWTPDAGWKFVGHITDGNQ